MVETAEARARDMLDELVRLRQDEDIRAAAIGYALLAVRDAIDNLAGEVEKAGWAVSADAAKRA